MDNNDDKLLMPFSDYSDEVHALGVDPNIRRLVMKKIKSLKKINGEEFVVIATHIDRSAKLLEDISILTKAEPTGPHIDGLYHSSWAVMAEFAIFGNFILRRFREGNLSGISSLAPELKGLCRHGHKTANHLMTAYGLEMKAATEKLEADILVIDACPDSGLKKAKKDIPPGHPDVVFAIKNELLVSTQAFSVAARLDPVKYEQWRNKLRKRRAIQKIRGAEYVIVEKILKDCAFNFGEIESTPAAIVSTEDAEHWLKISDDMLGDLRVYLNVLHNTVKAPQMYFEAEQFKLGTDILLGMLETALHGVVNAYRVNFDAVAFGMYGAKHLDVS